MLNRRICALIFSMLWVTGASAEAERSLEYSWLTDGRITGQQRVEYRDDASQIAVHFSYADRGRGPDYRTEIKLSAKGFPVSFEAAGVNNTRATIKEVFANRSGTATWASDVENGSSDQADRSFYLPFNSAPEVVALLARALLADPDHRVDLLPDGQANIERITTATFSLGQQSREATLYRLAGVEAGPSYLWLDQSGDLFSLTRKHFVLMPKGWESSLEALKAVEGKARSAYYEQLAEEHTQRLTGLTAIRGARVFDSVNARLTPPSTVFIWNGMISAIYPGETDIPDDTRVIDAGGRTLIPGLWDMHNHVGAPYLLNYLAFGVTNVRDMGSVHKDLMPLIQDLDDDRIAGPDIHPMGFIDRKGLFAAPVGRLADTLDEALAHVDFYARHGYRGIKIYSAIRPDWITPIAAAAHARDLPVAGHIPAFVSARDAIDAGFNEITHANQFLLAFLGGGELDTRGPERFLVPGIQTGKLDIDSPQVNDFLAFMREHNVAHDTTLAVIIEMFRNQPGEISPIFADIVDHLPVAMRRLAIMYEGYNQGHEPTFARSSDVLLKMMAKLHAEGIALLPGTDSYMPGMTLLRELLYYAEAGIPAAEVLQLGTIVPARHMGVDHRVGSIEVGKEAQMFLVDGNPLQDLHALYRVAQVFKGKNMYYAPDLLRSQGVRPFFDAAEASQ